MRPASQQPRVQGHGVLPAIQSWHLAKGCATVFFVLGLKSAGKVLVAFICNNKQFVDRFVEDTQPILIDWKTQTAADLLALLNDAHAFVECADLENIGAVPSFTQGRVAE